MVPGRALDLLLRTTRAPVTTPGGCPPPADRPSASRETAAPCSRLESMDGKDLIYKREFGDSPLLALPLAGGPARQLVPCVSGVNFAVGPAGIYYAACGPGPAAIDSPDGQAGARSRARDDSRPLGLSAQPPGGVAGRQDHPGPAADPLRRSDVDRELQVTRAETNSKRTLKSSTSRPARSPGARA